MLFVDKQGRLLRGLHGEGEEDGKDVRHEVCEEEAEKRPEPGERDLCPEKVNFSPRRESAVLMLKMT